MPDGGLMLHHVAMGRLASGEDAGAAQDDDLPPIADLHLRLVTTAAFDLSARILEDLERDQPPVLLTLFLRKILRFVAKGGASCSNPSFLTRVAYTADFVFSRPKLITGKAGFAALAELASDNQAAARHRARRAMVNPDIDIEEMRAKAYPPPAFIRWRSDDGNYELQEAAHPFHVWELGVRYGNCLDRVNPYDYGTRVKPKHSTLLPRLRYWTAISSGAYQLFSLRQGTTIICILGILHGSIVEFAIRHPDEPCLWELLADVTQYFDTRYGEFLHDLSRETDPPIQFVEHVNAARKRRGLKPVERDTRAKNPDLTCNDPRLRRPS